MIRILRVVIKAATALSLLLNVALMTLWVRSYRESRCDRILLVDADWRMATAALSKVERFFMFALQRTASRRLMGRMKSFGRCLGLLTPENIRRLRRRWYG